VLISRPFGRAFPSSSGLKAGAGKLQAALGAGSAARCWCTPEGVLAAAAKM